MVGKTRKHRSIKNKKVEGIQTIPELRRSFEHMEKFINEKIRGNLSKDELVRDLRKEWFNVFVKRLNKKSAEAFINDRLEHCKSTSRHRTLRKKGGAAALDGSPVNYSTRAGIYLAPGQIPSGGSSITSFSDGHYPITNVGSSVYGSLVKYVDSGFRNPEPGQSYDPVKGQSSWPIVPKDMGSNEVRSMKGGKRKTIRKKGGGLFEKMENSLSVLVNRPVPGSAPQTFMRDFQDMSYGLKANISPDQIERQPHYLLNQVYPKPLNIRL
jgi:hypothetical protein